MSINMPVYIPPKTRQWATSALVLGIIFFLFSIPNFFNYQKSVTMFGAKANISMIITAVDALIALVFIAAAAGVLKGNSWGREGLTYASAAGIVTTVLGSVWSWIMTHDPAFLNAFNNPRNGPSMPGLASIVVTATAILTIVVGIVQIVYCFCLYRHMSAEPEPMPSMPHDPGAWPPASQSGGVWPPPPAG
jgi:hypothetical protein